ncbi:MAG: preprotein translocase subunit SecY [Brooklawnia sp.]|jgi:preprotein translocase subunit SecY
MLSAFLTAFRTPDLRKKLLFTMGILVLFRLGSSIPSPNVNTANIRECAAGALQGEQAGAFSMINMFSGGALLHLSVFALGIMPYITSSIILQLLVVVIPRLETLKKEGGQGREKITQYTRWLTIVLAVLQATSFTMLAINGQLFATCSLDVVYSKEIFPIVVMIMTMTAGTSIIMWFGELITDRGVGNGMSVLIFTQIAARFPASMWNIRNGQADPNRGLMVMLIVIAIGLLVMAGVVYVEQSQRRIPVQYAKRMVGNRLLGGSSTYIPLKVNQAGVIPVIFASSILYLPVLYTMFQPTGRLAEWIAANMATGTGLWYNIIFFLLIIGFAYFYVSITFDPVEISDNMKKYGGFIPGIRAGKPTEDYLAFVLSRLTAPGSLYLATISLLPSLAILLFNADQNFPFGGTSLLIMVGVGLDTVKQIESQLHQRNYEGMLK